MIKAWRTIVWTAALAISMTAMAKKKTLPKVDKTPAPGVPVVMGKPVRKSLDMMALAKDLTTVAGDDAKFGEAYGDLMGANPQARTYKPNDKHIMHLMVVLKPGTNVPQGVALVVEPKNPLTLRDVEHVFGHGQDIKAQDAPGFTAYGFTKIGGKYPVEPVAFIPADPSKVGTNSPIFRLLLRRTATP